MWPACTPHTERVVRRKLFARVWMVLTGDWSVHMEYKGLRGEGWSYGQDKEGGQVPGVSVPMPPHSASKLQGVQGPSI